jgi:replicative DNA helicase
VENEVEVLSAICHNKDLSAAMSQPLDECFTHHPEVYDYIKDYYKQYRAVPDASILEKKFVDFKAVEITQPTQYYIDRLKDVYIKNLLGNMGVGVIDSIKTHSAEAVVAKVQKDIVRMARLTNSVKDLDITDWEGAEGYFDNLRTLTDELGGAPGIRTGFPGIDTAYPTGMAPGHLVVMIGWPGRGKSWFSEYMMCKAWEQGHRPMIISMEMSPEDMRNRIYTLMGSGIFRMSDFQRGMVNVDDFRDWGKKQMTNKQEFIIVSNEGIGQMTTDTIQAKIDQYRPSIVVVDYHQLLTDSARSSGATERNMNVSIELKRMATRNNIPIVDIVAATMSDISDQDEAPLLSQVAWSRQIEYDADMAMAVHQTPGTKIVQVISRKNRHGTDFAFYIEADFSVGTLKEFYGNDDS